jgi:hypothetical protein
MDGPGLLKRFDAAWVEFTDSYAGLSETDLLEPGVTKTWSVRDIIAHVTTWEEEALKHLPSILAGRKPPRYSVTHGGIDAFNATMTARKEGLSLAEVLKQQQVVHRRVVSLIKRAPGSHLAGDTRFRRSLRLDTYRHYRLHAEAIRRWRDQRGRPGISP